MHKFFLFTRLKPTFSILHTYFYKTPTSVCLLYIFIHFFATQPPTHTHSPHRNPHNPSAENQKNKPSKMDQNPLIKIDASGGDGKNEKQDRRFTSMPPVAMARTRNKINASKGKRWRWRWRETFNPIQPETH